MTFIQDLELGELIVSDIVAVAQGKPVAAEKTFGKTTIDISVVVLLNGPVDDYQVISGKFLEVLILVLSDVAAVAAGAPIKVAQKVGNTWYGGTFTVRQAA